MKEKEKEEENKIPVLPMEVLEMTKGGFMFPGNKLAIWIMGKIAPLGII